MRIQAIYAADAAGRRLPRAERGPFRATHLRPLMDEFFAWAAAARDLTPAAPSRPRRSATRSTSRPSCSASSTTATSLDNTRAERALRKIVVGRKNWLFYGTDTHAEAAAARLQPPRHLPPPASSTRSATSTRSCASCRPGPASATSSSRPSAGAPLAPARSGRPRAPDRPHRRPAPGGGRRRVRPPPPAPGA
ncbi:MAG: transposase [Kofleriaceae bacterium]|nr:transposase [Kofleriaceae bacterium]